MSSPVSPYLRAKLHGIKVTAVETKFELAFAGALIVGPRLAWAAGLSEFDRVEVYNMIRCETLWLHVLFGAESQVELWLNAEQRTQAGDTLRVTAYAWLPPDGIDGHAATLVQVGRNNAPHEIRRISARSVPIDPSFRPPPPREEATVRLREIPALSPTP